MDGSSALWRTPSWGTAPILRPHEDPGAVEAGTEAAIIEAIETVSADRTTFMISHDEAHLRPGPRN
jgi:hypothetical protein